jgi:CRISPR system Cascade subunit CasD
VIEIVLLRFDAPLMSFGGVLVDSHNRTDPLPYRAMLAGLFANALGFTRREDVELQALEERVRYAARRDRLGTTLVDFQTVDLDVDGPMDSDLAWTTRGVLEERKGRSAGERSHIRYRHYLADAIVTVAFTLHPTDEVPSLRSLSEALRTPSRPLFIGRKCCIPSCPVWLGETTAPSLRHALEDTPRVGGLRPGSPPRGEAGALRAVWPASGDEDGARLWPRVEDRDMTNNIHVGRRMYVEGIVTPPPAREQREESHERS